VRFVSGFRVVVLVVTEPTRLKRSVGVKTSNHGR
jgi:hypothetical protein